MYLGILTVAASGVRQNYWHLKLHGVVIRVGQERLERCGMRIG